MNLPLSIFFIVCAIPIVFLMALSIIWSLTPFRPCQKLCHDVFGWHEPKKNPRIKFDGVNLSCECQFCKRDIIQDSQGNWFVIG